VPECRQRHRAALNHGEFRHHSGKANGNSHPQVATAGMWAKSKSKRKAKAKETHNRHGPPAQLHAPAPMKSNNVRHSPTPKSPRKLSPTRMTASRSAAKRLHTSGGSETVAAEKLFAAKQPPKQSTAREMSASLTSLGAKVHPQTPQEVLEASLTFENTHHVPPLPMTLDRKSSSTSLHPTLDNISEAEIPDSRLEESWRNADLSSATHKKQPAVPQHIYAGRAASASLSENHASEPMGMHRAAAAAAAAFPEFASCDSAYDRKSNAAARKSTGSRASASAGASAVASYASTQSKPAGPGYAYIPPPNQYDTADDDDDLIALKRAAYGGGFGGVITASSTANAAAANIRQSSDQYQAAEATVVGYDVHPAELIGSQQAQAEFVGEDVVTHQTYTTSAVRDYEDGAAAAAAPRAEPFAATALTIPNIASISEVRSDHVVSYGDSNILNMENSDAAIVQGAAFPDTAMADTNIVTTAEVAVIGSEAANAQAMVTETWGSNASNEAQIVSNAEYDDETDLDRKPAALPSLPDGSFESEQHGTVLAGEEAEVLGFSESIHPSEFIEHQAQAELVGNDHGRGAATEQSEHAIDALADASSPSAVAATTMHSNGPMTSVAATASIHDDNDEGHALSSTVVSAANSQHAASIIGAIGVEASSETQPQFEHAIIDNTTSEMATGSEVIVEVAHEAVGTPLSANDFQNSEIGSHSAEAACAEIQSAQGECMLLSDRRDNAYDQPGHETVTSVGIEAEECAEVVHFTDEIHPSELGEAQTEAELIGTSADERIAEHAAMIEVVDEGGMADGGYDVNRQLRTDGGEYDSPVLMPQAVINVDATEGNVPNVSEAEEANNCAEVVSINEEYHPSASFSEAQAAQAELVGTDDGLVDNVAVVAEPHANHAEVIGEAHATLTHGTNAHAVHSESAIPVSSEIVEDDAIEPVEITTMIVEQEQSSDEEGEGNAESYDPTNFTKPPRPVAIATAARTISAPTSVQRSDNLNTSSSSSSNPTISRDTLLSSSIEEEWIRSSSNQTVMSASPLPPPVTGENNQSGSTVPPPPIPPRSNPVATISGTSRTSNRSDGSGTGSQGLRNISSGIARGTNTMMEMLFGDTTPTSRRRSAVPAGFRSSAITGSILPRTLLPSSVIHNQGKKNPWVATVNTNQKALDSNNVEEGSKSLRAFAVPSKKQAICLAKAWAPPRMHPFENSPECFICETRFAVFRRACHCRNCGVCVCSQCSLQWPAKMLPETYNIKKEALVNICKACDWLCTSFRLTLLEGDFDKAVALHATGNLNLTTPFANVKGELFYPVHCAVFGGNLKLLKWLVDEHCCPLRSIRISNGREKSAGTYTPILTSKGRSLLGIALGNRNIGMVRYLVVQKRMLLSAEKDLSLDTLVQNLDLVLRVLPEEVLGEQTLGNADQGYHTVAQSPLVMQEQAQAQAQTLPPPIPEPGAPNRAPSSSNTVPWDVSTMEDTTKRMAEESSTGSLEDACIICFSNPIDCVVTPCGHQICCLECSNNISRCPVCAVECSFMRVFKP